MLHNKRVIPVTKKGLALALASILLIAAPGVTKAEEQEPSIQAGGAVLIEAGSHMVLYAKTGNEKLPMASTTKIMTALLTLEHCALDETVVIPKEACGVEGSSMYLRQGEDLSVRDLLYGLMLVSGNDAAMALAIHVAGSVENFAQLMNARALELGARNTHFVTPNGLPDRQHYTTAYDLSLIAAEAMEREEFRQIVGSTYYKTTTGGVIRALKNKNRILWEYEGGCGVKTGYTKEAGKCLVFAAERNGMLLIGVVLNCYDMFPSAKEIMDYGFEQYEMATVIKAGDTVARIRVKGAEKTVLALLAKDGIMIPVKSGDSVSLRTEVEFNDSAAAPIQEGQALGLLRVKGEDNRVIKETELIAAQQVEPPDFGYYIGKLIRLWAA